MIMNHKKKSFEKGTSEEYQYKFKISIYAVMHKILQNNICNTPLYCLLLTIEILQFMYYPIHPIIDFLWTNETLSYLRLSLRYFQYNYLLDEGLGIFLILQYISFGVILIYSIIFFTLMYQFSTKQFGEEPNSFQIFILKIMSIFSLVLNTICTLPFYNVFLACVYCRSETKAGGPLDCYVGLHILHLIVASIGLILLLFFNIVITLLFFDLNPKAQFPISGYQSDAEYAKMLYKLVVPFLIIFNAPGNFNSEMIVVLGIAFIMLLYFRYSYPSGYNGFIQTYKLSLELILLWESICVNITNFLDTGAPDDMGILYLFVLIPPIIFGGLYAFRQKDKESLISVIKHLKNEQEADNYIKQWIVLLQNRTNLSDRLKLFAILKLHYVNCTKPECLCQTLIKIDLTKEESPSTTSNWMILYSQLINEIVDKYEDCPRFRIFYSYVSNDELKNKYNSLHYMMKAEDKKADLREEFCLFRFKDHIESQMQEEAENQQDIDVNKIVYFENQFVILNAMIEKCVESHLEFWRELQEDNPNVIKLQNIGIKVLLQIDQCDELYQELIEINPNNLNLLEIYSNYLQNVVHNYEEASAYATQISTIKKQIYQRRSGAQDSKITDSQETIIISMSGNYEDLGTVFSCNNQICKALGFYATELVGQNISQIMPKIIGDFHNNLVLKFLQSSKSQIVGLERFVLAQNKSQFLIPCKLMIKVLPNLDKGILIVGFLKPQAIDDGEYYMIYDPISFTVLHFSQGMMDDFGLNFEMIQAEGSLQALFKDLCDLLMAAENSSQVFKESEDRIVQLEIDGQQVTQLKLENMRESMKKKDQMVESAINLQSKVFMGKFKVKMQLIDDRLLEDKLTEDKQALASAQIHIVRLHTEFDNEEYQKELSMMKSRKQKMHDQSKSQIVDDLKLEEHDEKQQIQINQDENDEDKPVKDVRDALESGKVPQQVVYLKYLNLFLFVSILALSISKLVLSLYNTTLIDEGVAAIRQAHRRHSSMADINLYSRYLDLVAQDLYDSNLESPFKYNLSVLVDKLQTVQFDMIEFRIKIENRVGYSLDSDQFEVQFLLTNNQTKTYTQIFNDAIFAYITSASSFKKAELSTFLDSSSSVAKNFYYVVQNGLFVLRNGSETIAQRLYDFYDEQVENCRVDSIAILISSLIIILICNLLYIPILMNIHNEKKRLLSFFGILVADDIRSLIDHGDQYLKDYIKKYSDPQDDNIDMKLETSQQIESKSASSMMIMDKSLQDPENTPHLDANLKQEIRTSKEFVPRKSYVDLQREKHKRMFDSKGGSHYGLIFAFIILGSFLMVEYIIMYIVEVNSITYTKTIMNHYLYISRRASIIKYNILFTLEFIVNDGEALTYEGNDLSEYYNELVYENEQNLFRTLTYSYPSQFDPYFAYFNNVNFLDLCNSVSWFEKLKLITQSFVFYDSSTNTTIFTSSDLMNECTTLKGGLLTKGLRDAIFLVSLGNNEILASFVDKNTTLKSEAFQSQELLRKYILPTLWENNNLFQQCFYDYLALRNNVQTYNFIGFICLLILMFLYLWVSYIKTVQQSIFQSQKMLTLIPRDLIDKHPSLKQAVEKHILGQKMQQPQ